MSCFFSWQYIYQNFTEKYDINTTVYDSATNETVDKPWKEEVKALVGASLDAILASQSYNKTFFKTLSEEARLFFNEYQANVSALVRTV